MLRKDIKELAENQLSKLLEIPKQMELFWYLESLPYFPWRIYFCRLLELVNLEKPTFSGI